MQQPSFTARTKKGQEQRTVEGKKGKAQRGRAHLLQHCQDPGGDIRKVSWARPASSCSHCLPSPGCLSPSPFPLPSSSFPSPPFSPSPLSLFPGYFFAFWLPYREIFCFFISIVFSGPSIVTTYWSSLPHRSSSSISSYLENVAHPVSFVAVLPQSVVMLF